MPSKASGVALYLGCCRPVPHRHTGPHPAAFVGEKRHELDSRSVNRNSSKRAILAPYGVLGLRMVLFIWPAWLGSGGQSDWKAGQSLHHVTALGSLGAFCASTKSNEHVSCLWANDRVASGGPNLCSATAATDSTMRIVNPAPRAHCRAVNVISSACLFLETVWAPIHYLPVRRWRMPPFDGKIMSLHEHPRFFFFA